MPKKLTLKKGLFVFKIIVPQAYKCITGKHNKVFKCLSIEINTFTLIGSAGIGRMPKKYKNMGKLHELSGDKTQKSLC